MRYEEHYNKIKNKPDLLQEEIRAAVATNHEDVLTDMLRQASTYLKWGYLQVLAEQDYRRLKYHIEEDVLHQARINAEQILIDAGRKVTVQAKEDVARSDPSYKMTQEKLIEAQTRSAILKKVCEALVHKRDMLQSLNSRQKIELTAIPEDYVPTPVSEIVKGPEKSTGTRKQVWESTGDPDQSNESEVAELAKKYRSMRRRKRESEK